MHSCDPCCLPQNIGLESVVYLSECVTLLPPRASKDSCFHSHCIELLLLLDWPANCSFLDESCSLVWISKMQNWNLVYFWSAANFCSVIFLFTLLLCIGCTFCHSSFFELTLAHPNLGACLGSPSQAGIPSAETGSASIVPVSGLTSDGHDIRSHSTTLCRTTMFHCFLLLMLHVYVINHHAVCDLVSWKCSWFLKRSISVFIVSGLEYFCVSCIKMNVLFLIDTWLLSLKKFHNIGEKSHSVPVRIYWCENEAGVDTMMKALEYCFESNASYREQKTKKITEITAAWSCTRDGCTASRLISSSLFALRLSSGCRWPFLLGSLTVFAALESSGVSRVDLGVSISGARLSGCRLKSAFR